LAVEDGDDPKRASTGMDQEAGEFILLIAMQEAMANGFAQAAEVVKDDLGGGAELVLA
jgi:hypothetical protein